jgi:hypothetical protein
MARWIVDTPVSPARRKLRRELARSPLVRQRLRLNEIDPLVRLYDDGAQPAELAVPTPAAALEASRLFAAHYHHAAPFSRAALAGLWQRCAVDPLQREACQRALAEVTATLGDLGL